MTELYYKWQFCFIAVKNVFLGDVSNCATLGREKSVTQSTVKLLSKYFDFSYQLKLNSSFKVTEE